MSLQLSIVIPTHNRAEVLRTCLQKIFASRLPHDNYEVIVVDDASTDNTKEVCLSFKEGVNLTYVYQQKSGQGVARNKGIDLAEGNIILFLGDDIFVTPTTLEEHLDFHKQHQDSNVAVLGLILWDPNIEITALMRWSTNGSSIFGKFGGHQFAFEKLEHQKPANHNFFYTSNISLPHKLLLKEKFDPWFDGYGWEDIELGYRLEKNHNLQIIYNSNAVAYHHHPISLEDFSKRMFQIGKATHLIQKKHPELNKLPTFSKKLIFQIISSRPALTFLRAINSLFNQKLNPIYFYCLSKHFYLKGLKQVPEKLKA